MLDVGGYVLLALATVLALLADGADPAWWLTTVALALAAAAWIYVGYTRLPRAASRASGAGSWCSSSACVVLASILMLRQPLFFIFMIAGFFYATVLRPYPVAVAAISATSVLVNSLLAGLPATGHRAGRSTS